MLATTVKVSNKGVFEKLKKCGTRRAVKASAVHAYRMMFTLKHRDSLGPGLGQYPQWDGSGGKKSKDSAGGWYVNRKDGESEVAFYLTNKTLGDDGYHYPNILAYGMPANKADKNPFWKYAPSKNIVVGPDGRRYSKQMPQGIQPWVDDQKEVLLQSIKDAVAGCKNE